MMMVEAEEGSPGVEFCRAEEEEVPNDIIDLDSLWRLLGEPPQDNIMADDSVVGDLTGIQNAEGMLWENRTPNYGVVSPVHNFEASESERAGFVEPARNSCNLGGGLEPSSQLSQGNGFFFPSERHWEEDENVPSESRQETANDFVESAWNSSFSYGQMLEPSSSLISQSNECSYIHADAGFLNASSYCNNDSTKAPFETQNHRDQYNFNSADFVNHNQQSSDEKGTNLAPFETSSYSGPSSFRRFNNSIHKQDSTDFRHLNLEGDLFRMEYSANVMPARGNESKKPFNLFPNEYNRIQSHIKVEKNVILTPSTDIVYRASEVVDPSINGGPGQLSSTDGIEWPSSKYVPPIYCKNYGIHSKVEAEEESEHHGDVLPLSITTVKMENGNMVPPLSISTAKMENEVPKFYGIYQGLQTKTSEQSSADDDADLCILEDMSAPARSNHVAMSEKLVGAKQVLTSRDPGIQTVITHSRRKPNDERVIFRVALQDLSQPKSEASPPDGVLSVSLLKHQRIALSWMANKETRSACCSGGILADDQGLGKTISTIALILKERAPLSKASKTNVKQSETEMLNLDDDDGVLDNGYATKGAEHIIGNGYPINNCKVPLRAKGRPSGGTLIVCPTSVLRQWSDELHNKVTREADLSVLVYYGSSRTKDPHELAKYDVVVTTYAIVSMEVPKQPVVNENDDLMGFPYKDSSSCGKRKILETMSDKKSSKKSRKGTDNELLENASGPLAQVGWFRVVLDEAQSIKNHRTQVARACWGLRAKRRWCLSGTPIQNAIDDLYSYFRFLRHEPYAVFRTFRDQLKVPINKNPRNGYKKLQAVLKTIMLRRTKGTSIDGEPIIDLPPKTIELKKVDFSKDERDFYCRLEAESRAQFAEYAAAGTVKQNYVNILLMLLRLRQACDHPLLVKGFNSNSKVASSIEMAKKLPRERKCFLLDCLEGSLAICGICSDPPEDAVVTVCGHVFCNQCVCEHISGDDTQCPAKKCKTHLTMSSVFSIATLRTALSDQPSMESTTNLPDSRVAEASEPQMLRCPLDSSKIRAALDLLLSLTKPQDCTTRTSSSENIEGSNGLEKLHVDSRDDSRTSDLCRDLNSSVEAVGQKAIVFSQWTGMLDLLESCLKSSGIQYRRLDGTMPIAARDRAVKDFNLLPEVSVMIMSLKAASLGLNMVAACNVLLLDLWWNPTTEDQAIDRAHRIGQTRPVSVYRLTVKDTVEDRILALQQKKRKMVAYAFGEDETGTRQSRLTVEDLKYLFRAD
ncbi:SNF2 domain-containing protein / helicase domain-containing protein / zinc finger protein-like protein [Perilla frutescens var. hirtella]|uniref:SNF2 domain-containing protein / helicase domain-containing protein / zinc finger protein-like protein n=1 Tax=Perilla frutescens var. hirtella TaxID=608512 RepID=A0AAD4J1N3_PERFH|nr:SNF2 domain-containing protein / helicase domain-containing protein / zinc finger protein-like protein [Perilla frutescens var. hirtella]